MTEKRKYWQDHLWDHGRQQKILKHPDFTQRCVQHNVFSKRYYIKILTPSYPSDYFVKRNVQFFTVQ